MPEACSNFWKSIPYLLSLESLQVMMTGSFVQRKNIKDVLKDTLNPLTHHDMASS